MERGYEISIEVADDAFPASSWQHAYGDVLVREAVSQGATEWRWVERRWGVILEIRFPDEANYLRWRAVPAVRSAFDAVPGRLVFHRGWGGTSGSAALRPRGPLRGAGGAAVPLPTEPEPPAPQAAQPPLCSPAPATGAAALT